MPKGKRKERKIPSKGMIFSRSYKGVIYTLEVIEEDGVIKYSLNGKTYNSPTGAAESLVKNKYEVNGWVFWGMKNY